MSNLQILHVKAQPCLCQYYSSKNHNFYSSYYSKKALQGGCCNNFFFFCIFFSLQRVKNRSLEDVVLLNVDTNNLENPFNDLSNLPGEVVSLIDVSWSFSFVWMLFLPDFANCCKRNRGGKKQQM